MSSDINIADPCFKLSEIIECGLLNENTFFIGCLSFEERCIIGAKSILEIGNIPLYFIKIENDECTFPVWEKECRVKKKYNLEKLIDKAKSIGKIEYLETESLNYKMGTKNEDIIKFNNDFQKIKENLPKNGRLRCILDITCLPSYFSFQIIRKIIIDPDINDFVLIYTKPNKYPPKSESLKISPSDISKPDFLPSFGRYEKRFHKTNWIVGVGFDYASVKSANRIKEIVEIDNLNVLIPFPGYRPEYVFRAMKVNQNLLNDDGILWFAPADNPFRTFKLISNIVQNGGRYILSSFGPKPMALGFCLAAIKHQLKVFHVQATNYNPNFSQGSRDTSVYWLKNNSEIWWDKI